MTLTSRIVLALAGLGLLPLTPAVAADYDPPIYADQAPDYVPVEVGSGWYLRGDVSYLAQKSFKNDDFAFTPASFDEKEDPIFASIGFGYHSTIICVPISTSAICRATRLALATTIH